VVEYRNRVHEACYDQSVKAASPRFLDDIFYTFPAPALAVISSSLAAFPCLKDFVGCCWGIFGVEELEPGKGFEVGAVLAKGCCGRRRKT